MHIHTYTYIHTLRAFNEIVAHLYSAFWDLNHSDLMPWLSR